jgi:alpha-tubulin suppressor-like RCC1 family protein
VQVKDLSGVTQLSVGHEHACVLGSGGGVLCWGENNDGELGDGTMTNHSMPVTVTVPPAQAIACGNDTSCAVGMDGSVQCWGENNDGELGVGDTAAHTRPTAVVDVAKIVAVGAGDDFTCFLSSEGVVSCAGLGDDGRLGNGLGTQSSRPVTALMPVRAVAIDAGANFACAKDEIDGTWCWGYGGDGRLLTADGSTRSVPVRGVLDKVDRLSCGGEAACVLDTTGAIRCAGFNRRGQLGDGRPVTYGAPVEVAGVSNAVMVAAGGNHSCAAQADGQVLCWGADFFGQTGNGSFLDAQPVAHVVYGVANPKQLIAGDDHTCALMQDGSTYCWGHNDNGQLGDGTNTSSAQPRLVPNIGVASELSIGDTSSFAKTGGGEQCWGNSFGTTPTTVSGPIDITAGGGHVCTVEGDRSVMCYGANTDYQIGDNTQTFRPAPGVSNGVTNAAEVQARGNSSCARLMDGTIKCWGLNGDGRLGVGNTNYRIQTPTAVMGISNVMKFAMGWDASCAIKTDNTLWCWGANYFGQVGDGTYQTRTAAVQLTDLSGAKDVSSGGSHTCAVTSAGSVVCWGLAASGELGNGIREIIRPVGVEMTCP